MHSGIPADPQALKTKHMHLTCFVQTGKPQWGAPTSEVGLTWPGWGRLCSEQKSLPTVGESAGPGSVRGLTQEAAVSTPP